jgi:hypothetical protein
MTPLLALYELYNVVLRGELFSLFNDFLSAWDLHVGVDCKTDYQNFNFGQPLSPTDFKLSNQLPQDYQKS